MVSHMTTPTIWKPDKKLSEIANIWYLGIQYSNVVRGYEKQKPMVERFEGFSEQRWGSKYSGNPNNQLVWYLGHGDLLNH